MNSLIALLLLLDAKQRDIPTPTKTPCAPPPMSKPARDLLSPVLSEYISAHREEFDASGRYIRESPHQAVFEKRFYALLQSQSTGASEAIAALLCFYVGEHPAEELLCEATHRGSSIKPYLQRFRNCPPQTGLEPIDPFFTNIPNLRSEALNYIRSGRKCSDD